MKRSSVRLGVLFIAILAVGVLVNAWAYLGEAHIERKQLKEFPTQVGVWQQSGSGSSTRRSDYESFASD
jgi:hypothetical protein